MKAAKIPGHVEAACFVVRLSGLFKQPPHLLRKEWEELRMVILPHSSPIKRNHNKGSGLGRGAVYDLWRHPRAEPGMEDVTLCAWGSTL